MALPSSGSITAAQINTELGRAANAAFSMNGPAERALAAKASGAISFSDFLGKSSEIVVTLAAGGSAITLESLFSPSDWTGETAKRVILPAGVERGNSSTLDAAVTIGPTAWGGSLTFDVRGTISGKGGAANSGVGGNAFQANRVGNANQKLQLLLSGVLRGGGGGGGQGGTGGAGSATAAVREPETGEYFSTSPAYSVTETYNDIFKMWLWSYNWNSTSIAGNAGLAPASVVYAGYTYYRGTNRGSGYGIYRTITSAVATAGGVGGAGGQGEGYGQSRAPGSNGVAGGTNAGMGGTGGAGGLFGASGSTGSTGSNGTAANGSAGAAGGLAGYGLLGSANVTLTNTGSILGRTG
jgi:hypothetical protein